MTTLLQAVNDVLLQVGERPASTLTNPVSRKAVLAIEAALIDINAANTNWSFKQLNTPVTQQVQETLTIPGLERIDKVHYRETTGLERELPFMALSDMRETYQVKSGIPKAYSIVDDETIVVLPYPEELGKIIVYGTKSIVAPSEPSEEIPLPVRFYPLLLTRALYHMLLTHLSDTGASQAKNAEFLALVGRMVQQENKVTRQNRSMYRGRR